MNNKLRTLLSIVSVASPVIAIDLLAIEASFNNGVEITKNNSTEIEFNFGLHFENLSEPMIWLEFFKSGCSDDYAPQLNHSFYQGFYSAKSS